MIDRPNSFESILIQLAWELFSIECRTLVQHATTETIHLMKSYAIRDLSDDLDVKYLIDNRYNFDSKLTIDIENQTQCGRSTQSMLKIRHDNKDIVTCKRCLEDWKQQLDKFPINYMKYYRGLEPSWSGLNKYRV